MRAGVVFDVGETLMNETRLFEEWADYLGVPRLTFMGALGATIERREHHREAFRLFEPDLTLEELFERRKVDGLQQSLSADDLYPDAVPCLARLQEAGYLVGVAGNQPKSVFRMLSEALPKVELVATSDGWGVEKPSPEFFTRVASELDLPPDRIAYVGDRVDNDIIPAADAGMIPVFLRRGPWGYVQGEWPEASKARLRIDSLNELPGELTDLLPPD